MTQCPQNVEVLIDIPEIHELTTDPVIKIEVSNTSCFAYRLLKYRIDKIDFRNGRIFSHLSQSDSLGLKPFGVWNTCLNQSMSAEVDSSRIEFQLDINDSLTITKQKTLKLPRPITPKQRICLEKELIRYVVTESIINETRISELRLQLPLDCPLDTIELLGVSTDMGEKQNTYEVNNKIQDSWIICKDRATCIRLYIKSKNKISMNDSLKILCIPKNSKIEFCDLIFNI